MSNVPTPWTPVEFEMHGTRAVAKVWGRTYTWDNSILPTSIQTADREILTAPATLHAKFKGKEEPFTQTAFTPISVADDKVMFTIGQTAGNIIVNARVTIEYDGYIEWALSVIPFWSFSPDNGAYAKLDGLWFEFPLTKESSDLFHFWPNGESGLIPDPTIMASGAVPAEGVACPFKPYFWAGWEFGGFGICTESDENIQLKPGTPVIQLENQPQGRRLRWNLLNKEPHQWGGRADRWTDALAPIDYIFGLQATPVKAERTDRMNIKIYHYGYHNDGTLLQKDEAGKNMLDYMAEDGINWIIFHEAWSAMQNYGQAVDEPFFLECVKECHKRGIRVMTYFGYEYPTNAPEWHEKKDNYLIKTPEGHLVGGWQRMNPPQRDYMVCYAGGYAEGMRERVRHVMDDYGVDGIYTDGTYVPWECANADHGCGYTDKNGVRHTTYPVFAVRKHVKALYELVHEKGGIIDTHQSSCLLSPTLGFADSFYNGESFQGAIQNFKKAMKLESYRTEYMGKNLGIFPQLLATVNEKFTIEKATSLSLIHDVLPRPGSLKSTHYLSKLWNTLNEFGSGEAKWHPYWIDDGLVKIDAEDVYCSIYEKDGAYLAAVSSFNEETDKVTLTFPKNVTVESVTPGDANVFDEDNVLKLDIQAFRPELIKFTMK